jgi:XTP/dITP diphosphohydrolase
VSAHPIQKLVIATGNPGKLREMQTYLGDRDLELQRKPPALDIEETGQTFAENAALKATQVAKTLGEWAIADDSGLSIAALGGAPGLYSARYGQTDTERIARVLRELGKRRDRAAEFICALAIAHPDGSVAFATEGRCPGEILEAPRGTGGFGYDPIFFVPEAHLTFAEMTPEQKDRLSHRGRAFANLLAAWDGVF